MCFTRHDDGECRGKSSLVAPGGRQHGGTTANTSPLVGMGAGQQHRQRHHVVGQAARQCEIRPAGPLAGNGYDAGSQFYAAEHQFQRRRRRGQHPERAGWRGVGMCRPVEHGDACEGLWQLSCAELQPRSRRVGSLPLYPLG